MEKSQAERGAKNNLEKFINFLIKSCYLVIKQKYHFVCLKMNSTISGKNSPIFRLLKARGFRISACNPKDQLLIQTVKDEKNIRRFYDKLGKYSFRLFLREVLENQNRIHPQNVSRYCSPNAATRYLWFLVKIGLLQPDGDSFHLNVDFVPNFGETLEWYIAELFKREFGSQAIYRAMISKSKIGGDWDVLAAWINRLVYLEVKSSPPKAVDAAQIKMFFHRLWELLPDVAIFLEDTQLRMADKIVPLFQEELARRYGSEEKEKYPVVRLRNEIFHINHSVYIVNSKGGLMQNILRCLRDYLRKQQQLSGMP